MTGDFQFSATPKIIFGNRGISRLPSILKKYGNRVVLVTGSRSFESGPHSKVLMQELEKGKTEFRIVNIGGEPSPEMIDAAVSQLKTFEAVVIVAIGGGSVMDAGKAISGMLKVDGSVTEFLEDVGTREHPGTKVPFIAVPTTSGTGSEATKNAVISRTGGNGFKRSLRHDSFVPDIAIVDPELTITCPKGITAASGMDCFSQLTEAYLSTKANKYTDALAIEGIKAVKDSLVRAYTDGSDINARNGMSFAALTSGICLANAGLGVVHGFASSIGGMFDIPHGLVCGTLMASANKVTVNELERSWSNPVAYGKYAELGKIFADNRIRSDKYYIESFISFLYELSEKLGLPKLSSAGFQESASEEICSNTGSKNNPVALGKEHLMEILSERLS